MQVVFYEVFEEEKAAIEKQLEGSIRAEFRQEPIQHYQEAVPPAEVISIRTQSRIPNEWQLRGILTRSTGFDHLTDWQTKSNCGYLPTYCSRAVAEHTILMILALLKNLRQQLSQLHNFNRNRLTCLEALGRHLLVIGVGNIGKEIVQLGQALGMQVRGVDLEEREPHVTYTDLSTGIGWADIIVCALPLTPETDQLLNYTRLHQAQPGTLFVNISRGEISPLADLQKLLAEGTLGGIGLDVYDQEHALADQLKKKGPDPTLAEFLQDERVICTPHNAFNTREGLARKAQQSAAALHQFHQKGTFPHPLPGEAP